MGSEKFTLPDRKPSMLPMSSGFRLMKPRTGFNCSYLDRVNRSNSMWTIPCCEKKQKLESCHGSFGPRAELYQRSSSGAIYVR